jgi:murein DD-endopeptidase MepM/ murein hydrolase activator NlpD
VFGEQWAGPSDTLHSGADIPAPYGEPVIAMASGVVILKSDGTEAGRKSRGTQIMLQHAPSDTGYPFWLYTLYSHFSKMPEWALGQRVQMGDVLGPNGRSGVPGANREPHLHLTLLVSDTPRYGVVNGTVVPEFGRFIDAPAIFRGKLPVDTAEMQKLQGDERQVKVSVMYEDGQVSPEGSKVVWPFRCKRR